MTVRIPGEVAAGSTCAVATGAVYLGHGGLACTGRNAGRPQGSRVFDSLPQADEFVIVQLRFVGGHVHDVVAQVLAPDEPKRRRRRDGR